MTGRESGADRAYLGYADECVTFVPRRAVICGQAQARRIDSPVRPDIEMWAWQLDALCRGLPSDVFYPPDNERGGSKRRREENAKKICRACPVLETCRAHAVAAGEPYGVWGGMTPTERQALRTL